MKRWMRCAVLALGCGLIVAGQAKAQQEGGTGATSAMGAGATPELVAGYMQKKLGLTDDQTAKITPVIADRQKQMQALRADTSERPMVRAKKMKGILADADKKIKAVLTPDQVTQYDAMEKQMMDQAKQRAQARKGE